MRFDLGYMKLNGAAAPAFVANQVMQTVNQRLDPTNLPVAVELIELAAGQASISGRTR